MRALISLYLLLKSARRRKFTRFDIDLASLLVPDWQSGQGPTWLNMIAGLAGEAELPEAFGFFVESIRLLVEDWCEALARKI